MDTNTTPVPEVKIEAPVAVPEVKVETPVVTTPPKKTHNEIQGKKSTKAKKISNYTDEDLKSEVNRLSACGHQRSDYFGHIKDEMAKRANILS